MIRLKFVLLKIVSIVTLFFLMLSCIKEDLSDCPVGENEIRIYIDYTITGTASPQRVNASLAERLDLFIFDNHGKYLETVTDLSAEVNSNYYMSITLAEGDYSFVVWGNLDTPYATEPAVFTPGVTDISDAMLYLAREEGDSIHTLLSHLFFGNLLQTNITNKTNQYFNIALKQNTNIINLTVIGLSPDDYYNYMISDTNGRYFFDNSFSPDKEIHYTADMTMNDQQQQVSSLTVLRLAEDREPVLSLTNKTTSELLYSHNLIKLIMKLEELGLVVDFNTMYQFDIVLAFDTEMNVSISINGWDIIEDGSELTPSS